MKKKLTFILILIIEILLLIAISIISYKFIYLNIKNKSIVTNSYISFYNKNKSNDFTISKVIAYSNAYGKSKNTNFNDSNWNLEIYQYTDFAIYINSNSNNFIKKIWIDSLNIVTPVLGKVSLYYEDALKFGTEYINSEFPFTDSLEFTVLNDKNEDNSIKYNTPIFFADCSTPLTLKYVNTVSSNLSLKNTNSLVQNGTILNNLIKDTSVIDSKVSFCIHLLDNNNVEYKSMITLNIPLSNDKGSILTQGNILKTDNNLNISFIK